jgi:hypothetical protein
LRFDLAQLAKSTPSASIFASPLPADDWVFGFQSSHNIEQSGILRVTGSTAGAGPLPLFSRDDSDPRGVLGGQDPDNITLHWGLSLSAVVENSPSHPRGDFNGNGVVDAVDFVVWRHHFGAASESFLNNAGDGLNGVDAADYSLWLQNFDTVSIANEGGNFVPEPSSVLLVVHACNAFLGRWFLLILGLDLRPPTTKR